MTKRDTATTANDPSVSSAVLDVSGSLILKSCLVVGAHLEVEQALGALLDAVLLQGDVQLVGEAQLGCLQALAQHIQL